MAKISSRSGPAGGRGMPNVYIERAWDYCRVLSSREYGRGGAEGARARMARIESGRDERARVSSERADMPRSRCRLLDPSRFGISANIEDSHLGQVFRSLQNRSMADGVGANRRCCQSGSEQGAICAVWVRIAIKSVRFRSKSCPTARAGKTGVWLVPVCEVKKEISDCLGVVPTTYLGSVNGVCFRLVIAVAATVLAFATLFLVAPLSPGFLPPGRTALTT